MALYLLVVLAGALAMVPFAPDLATAASAAITCVSNVGPGFAAVGPMLNFASVPAGGQAVLTALMLIGRLELYTVLAIFIPAFWRK